MWHKAILLLAVAATIVVLALPRIPLGVPSEWEWPRQQLPGSFSEVLDRLLWPLLVGAALTGYCRSVDQRISHFGRVARIASLGLLVMISVFWLGSVRQAAASPHREIRSLWVLYDKYASGYFFEAAFHIRSQHELLSTYEARMAKGDVLHEGTHPPGLFLLNWWALQATGGSPFLAEVSEWTQSTNSISIFRTVEADAALAPPLTREELAALCLVSFVSTVLSAMCLLPVYGIVKLLSDQRTAWRAACLATTIPSIAVFAPRSDIVYAFSGTLILWLILKALMSNSGTSRVVFAVLAGLVIFVSLTISLAHLPVLVMVAVFSGLMLFQPDLISRGTILVVGAVILTTLVAAIVFWSLATHCPLPRIWQLNLTNHAGFYSQSQRTWWKWFLINPLELAFSLGLPLALASVYGTMKSFRSPPPMRPSAPRKAVFRSLIWAMIFTWAALWLSGKNMGEAARLWCFLFPWFVIVAASAYPVNCQVDGNSEHSLQRRTRHSYDSAEWLWLLIAQLVVCTLTAGAVSGYSVLNAPL